MPGLTSPFGYECSNCNREPTVARWEARGLYPYPDSMNDLGVVLQEQGWMRGEIEKMLFCPDCTGGF